MDIRGCGDAEVGNHEIEDIRFLNGLKILKKT